MTGKYYGVECDLSDREDRENIEQFLSEGTPVILVEDVDDWDEPVIMVEKKD